MADLLISRTVKRLGVPYDLDFEPEIISEDGTVAMVRDDTGEVIIATSPVSKLTRQSEGVYARTVTGLSIGVAYTYWLKSVLDGVTSYVEKHVVVNSGTSAATSAFASGQDLILRYGLANIIAWSQIDPDNEQDTVNDARIQAALNSAVAEVLMALRTAGYEATSTFSSPDSEILKDVVVVMAGRWLFHSRPRASRKDNNPFRDEYENAKATLFKIRIGGHKLVTGQRIRDRNGSRGGPSVAIIDTEEMVWQTQ